MKRFIPVLISLLFVLSLAACASGSSSSQWKEAAGDDFSSVPVFSRGKLVSASGGDVLNVKIDDGKYEHFCEYIDELKAAGFEYYKIGDVPENFSLNEGQASWRGSDGKVFVQLIFSADETESREAFGCNVQLFAYKTDPWENVKVK